MNIGFAGMEKYLQSCKSEFFRKKNKNPASYVNRMKHADLKNIERTIAEYFAVKTEYFLGIKGTKIFQSRDSDLASLYVIKGTKLIIEAYET